MAYLDSTPRVGRSQGASIFWGLVSLCFATAACYYFWQNHENETSANVLRDQVLSLQEQRETLNSQKQKLESGQTEEESQLKTRADFLQEKETKLAEEETRLEALGVVSQNLVQQSQAQAAVVKKFDDTVRKLVKSDDTDVVTRSGRPVLRVPNSVFFDFGDAVLKPDGKALLTEIAQALNGQMDNFELRIECYTDTDAEILKTAPEANPDANNKPDPNAKSSAEKKPDTAPKPPPMAQPLYDNSWELTGARAATIAHFFRKTNLLPFQNVLVLGRADFQPIITDAKEGHARNRRIEITIAPVAPSFRSADTTHTASGGRPGTPADPLVPPADPPPATHKDKDKAKDKNKGI